MLTLRQRQQTGGKRVAIIQLTSATNPLLNVLLHFGLTMSQFKSDISCEFLCHEDDANVLRKWSA